MPSLQGLQGPFIHSLAAHNQIPDAGNGGSGQDNVLWLPIEPGGVPRTSEVTLPLITIGDFITAEMEWDPAVVIAASGHPGGWVTRLAPHPFWGLVTTVHGLVAQINQRQGLGAVVTGDIVTRCSLIDQKAATVWDFFPGATPLNSQANFPLFWDDDGDFKWEPRGVRLTLSTTHTPLALVDSGRILVRLNNTGLDEAPAPW